MSNDPKLIRKQIRNVLNEVLPDLLRSDVFKGLYEQLQAQNTKDLQALSEEVRATLQRIDQRSTDIQAHLLREISKQENAPQTEAK